MRTLVSELSGKIGETVSVSGFVASIRRQGSIAFIELRELSGRIQIVVSEPELLAQIEGITIESVVAAIGMVVISDQAKMGLEIQLRGIEVLSLAEPSLPIPVEVKSGNEAEQSLRLDWRWLDLRSAKKALIFQVWTEFERAFVEYCVGGGFTRIHTPKTVVTSTESGSELFEIKYFDQKAYLAQSPQLYKQMAMSAGLEKVFEIGPVFRANPSFTSRHDTEFTMYDIEMSYIQSHHELMDFEEAMMRAMFGAVDAKYGAKVLEHFGTVVAIPEAPFVRMAFVDAKKLLASMGVESTDEYDLSPEEERKLCEYSAAELGSEFVFVYDWYAKSRAFYSMKSEENPELCKSFDLLYRGLEVTSGAQREHRYSVLRGQIIAQGLGVVAFESYLNCFKYGCPPHGGFAPGPSRLIMKMLGLDNVREVTFLYRGVNRITP